MLNLLKKYKLTIGLSLLVQSASFVVLFFMLYKKKKSLAETFLAMSAIGGAAGAYLVLKAAKEEAEAYEQAAKDAFAQDCSGDCFAFDDCPGNCSECDGTAPFDAQPEIIVEDDAEGSEESAEEVIEEAAEEAETFVADAEEALDAVTEEIVAEAPIEDIFTEPVAENANA